MRGDESQREVDRDAHGPLGKPQAPAGATRQSDCWSELTSQDDTSTLRTSADQACERDVGPTLNHPFGCRNSARCGISYVAARRALSADGQASSGPSGQDVDSSVFEGAPARPL